MTRRETFPLIVSATLLGQNAPSKHIRIGQIGCGRIARVMDLPGVLKHRDLARVVAVCDLDSVRLADGKQLVEEAYAKAGVTFEPVKTYRHYGELLADKSIDAVVISTPDHWHAEQVIAAVLAGKDVWVQKPASLTVKEGRQMADAVARTGRILQIGSQQRSEVQFRLACELVRNGRLGQIREVFIGLPYDPPGAVEPAAPPPATLDYNEWLGSTPWIDYIENRVHPQSNDLRKRYDRPGWLRVQQFGAGMITGWGTHHFDIAHWAMGQERSGPVEITAKAEFPKSGIWDVHGSFHVRAKYANHATVYASDLYPNGVKFVGDEGWLWVTRGRYQPGTPRVGEARSAVLDASDLRWLRDGLGASDTRLHASPRNDHHLDWLQAMRDRTKPVTNAEEGHRSCSACLISHIAMKLDRTLAWDPQAERFTNSEEANRLLALPQRAPYGTDRVLASAQA
jgi:predicted dehydrogenase